MKEPSPQYSPLADNWEEILLSGFALDVPTQLSSAVEHALELLEQAAPDLHIHIHAVGPAGTAIVARSASHSGLQPVRVEGTELAINVGAVKALVINDSTDERIPAFRNFAVALVRHIATVQHLHATREEAMQRAQHLTTSLQLADKLAGLGRIVASVLHEINNPLTSLLAYAEMLKGLAQSGGPLAPHAERLGRIVTAAERIQHLSRDLLSYARPARDEDALVVIHDIIERSVHFCEHELERAGVSVVRDFGTCNLVKGQPDQLTQVFVNLITNACHAMPLGGRIRIQTAMSEAADRVIVRIHDGGTGVPTEYIDRIFEPFVTTKTAGRGTGLGLFIVSEVVRAQGGEVRLESSGPSGSTFRVSLLGISR